MWTCERLLINYGNFRRAQCSSHMRKNVYRNAKCMFQVLLIYPDGFESTIHAWHFAQNSSLGNHAWCTPCGGIAIQFRAMQVGIMLCTPVFIFRESHTRTHTYGSYTFKRAVSSYYSRRHECELDLHSHLPEPPRTPYIYVHTVGVWLCARSRSSSTDSARSTLAICI